MILMLLQHKAGFVLETVSHRQDLHNGLHGELIDFVLAGNKYNFNLFKYDFDNSVALAIHE